MCKTIFSSIFGYIIRFSHLMCCTSFNNLRRADNTFYEENKGRWII